MNEKQLNAHDRHYESDKMQETDDHPAYNQAFFQAIEGASGTVLLHSELRDVTTKLWELGYAIVPIGQIDSDPQRLTPDLVEQYGFVADEPGYWFLESDDEIDTTVRLGQSLRHQDQWRLFIDGAEGKNDVNVELTGLAHLLQILGEHGYEFYEDDQNEEGNDE